MRKTGLLLLVILAVLLGPLVLAADRYDPVVEYKNKADVLYGFALCTKWPAEALSDPEGCFKMGILGTDPWRGKLQKAYQQKGWGKVKGMPLVVTNCPGVAEARNCPLVFITKSVTTSLSQTLDALAKSNVLTVVESDGPTETVGVITLYVKDTVRYMINEAAMERARLTFTSEILQYRDGTFRK